MILSLLSKKVGGRRGEGRGVALIPFTVAAKARTVGLDRPGLGYLGRKQNMSKAKSYVADPEHFDANPDHTVMSGDKN